MTRRTILLTVAAALVVGVLAGQALAEKYEPNWESLNKKNPAPDWLRDAKFGIYFHWGVYCVPAYGSEWYPRNMHRVGGRENKHHIAKYGDPVEFGYDKFVAMFKAEKFDADEWADLFAKAGAKYAGPVCEHHDGFSMWDSELTPWNAADRGPKRDIAGELAKAIRKRGMRFVATFHHARNNLWEKQPGKWSGHYDFARKNYPKALEDKERAFMYGYMPREQFLKMWLGKLKEVIDKYEPDLMWFDSWLSEIPEKTRMEYLAYYFNASEKWGRDVVVTFKQSDLPREVAIDDYEKGRASEKTDFVWLTDDTISKGSWCYTDNLTIKDTAEVLTTFIDIISKNGQLLLNISPMADGSIPANQRKVLLEMGKWLKVSGEAVYGTRPWITYGEGGTKMAKGGHFVRSVKYKSDDVRFTCKGKTVYATFLGWAGAGEKMTLATFAKDGKAAGVKVKSVSLIGGDQKIVWQQFDEGLTVTMPDKAPNELAVAFKIETE